MKRPDRYRNSVVPHIYVDGAADGIDFYKRAFGAEELFRIAGPDGKILHADYDKVLTESAKRSAATMQ